VLRQIVQNDSILSSVVSPRSIKRSFRVREKRQEEQELFSDDFLYSNTGVRSSCDEIKRLKRRRRHNPSNSDDYASRLRCDTIEEFLQRQSGLLCWDEFCLIRKTVQDSDAACRGLYNQLFDLLHQDKNSEVALHAEKIQVALQPFLVLNVAESAKLVSDFGEGENGPRLTALCSKLMKVYKFQKICLSLWLSVKIKNDFVANYNLSSGPIIERSESKEISFVRSKALRRSEEEKIGEAKDEDGSHCPLQKQRNLVRRLRNELISSKKVIEAFGMEIEKGVQWISLNHNPQTILAKHYSIQFAAKKIQRLIFIRESIAVKKLFFRWQTTAALDAHTQQVASYFQIKCCHLLENILISNVVQLYKFSLSRWRRRCIAERNRSFVESCIIFQRFVRGFVSRRKTARRFEIEYRSARMIQMCYRCLLAKDMLNAAKKRNCEDMSVTMLQSMYRRKQAENALQEKREQHYAAIVLQCSARSRRSISTVEGKRSQKVAATRLQTRFRGRRAVNEFHHVRNAGSMFQKAWRGKMARSRVAHLRRLQLEQTQALILQSLWRGHCDRRCVNEKMRIRDFACWRINNCWRQYVVRKRKASVEEFAAICIQRWISRLHERRMNKAACTIQELIRYCQFKRSMKLGFRNYGDAKYTYATVIIQCAERARVARIKTRRRRDFVKKNLCSI